MLNLAKRITNLLWTDKSFADKQITIEQYLKYAPKEMLTKNRSFEDLYEDAVNYIGKQNFDELTKNIDPDIYPLSKDQGIIAVFLGMLAFAAAKEVDEHGSDMEQAINKVLPKDYDTNNAFDLRRGYGHRIFGHDIAAFGIDSIPAGSVIQVKSEITGKIGPMVIADFLGVDINCEVSMWDIIWKFYGDNDNKLSGVSNCLKHTIVHFGKDILTPNGLPLPFVSLFNKYEKFNSGVALQYNQSLYKQLNDLHINMKASDFASLGLIEGFTTFYFASIEKKNSNKILENEFKLVAMGTCICMQMAKIIIHDELQIGKKGNSPMVPGGNANLLLIGSFMKLTVQEMLSIANMRKLINDKYDVIGG